MNTINVGLVGISGYTGMELVRLLAGHPYMNLSMACSRAESGKKLGEFYPFLRSLKSSDLEITVYDPDQAAKKCDLVFLAVPAGTAMKMACDLVRRNVKVVDFSADFRLDNPAVYSEWYNAEHICPSLLQEAVYGLPELYEEEIKNARLVANPGCYPTASLLGLYQALKNFLVEPESIIIDAKSGASGAGRKAATANLFCEISDNFRAYGLPRHRHTPEIEQEITKICGKPVSINFTPHLVPMKRGILATIYANLKEKAPDTEEMRGIYSDGWHNKQWIRFLPEGELPQTINVRGSMFCDINFFIDERTNRIIIISAIDNLCRGASGQALANANLMCGLPVDCGLELAPLV